jgi:hypothetical protein
MLQNNILSHCALVLNISTHGNDKVVQTEVHMNGWMDCGTHRIGGQTHHFPSFIT